MADTYSFLERVNSDSTSACLAYESMAVASGLYPCQLSVLPEKLNLNHDTFAFQKDSPLKAVFDYHINKMKENGILDKVGPLSHFQLPEIL